MYSPLSDQWDVLIRSSGPRVVVADLYDSGVSSTPTLSNLAISSFSITADRRAAQRRSGTLTIVDEELLTAFKDDFNTSTFSPYGSEVRISSGVILSDDTQELVPLGVFQIDSLDWGDDNSQMVLQLVDRSKLLQRAELLFPLNGAGLSVQDLIRDLVTSVVTWTTVEFSPDLDDFTLPGGSSYSGDYLDVVMALSALMGGEFFFDTSGVGRVEPVPYLPEGTADAEAVWWVDSGDFGVLVSTSNSISRNDTFNEVAVTGASTTDTGAQPFYVARDTDASSRTYVYGPFGRSTLKVQRQELLTSDRCQLVAEATLRNSLGLSRSLSLNSIGNPALEEGDIILVEYPNESTELHLIDSISFNESGSSSVITRSKRVPS